MTTMRVSEFDDGFADERELRGAILSTPIAQLEPREAICVEPTTSVADAVHLMNTHRIGCVLVTRAGLLAGIFTERDVLNKVVGREFDLGKTPVGEVMTPNPETLRATDGIAFALNKMSVGGFRHIPIVDERGAPCGIISVKNIVDFIVSLFPEAVLDIPPDPQHALPLRPEGG